MNSTNGSDMKLVTLYKQVLWWILYTVFRLSCKITKMDLRLSCENQLGERRETPILKFNSPHPLTHLVCNAHLIANFLSFHMSLVVVVNCGGGNVLLGFEISMSEFFLKLYFIHPSKDILLLRTQRAIKQCKLCFFSRKPYMWRIMKI